MFALILAALMVPEPEPIPMPTPLAMPAYFEIKVESTTPFTIYMDGQRLEPNETYKTQPLEELHCVEIEVRFVSGGEVKKKIFFMDLEPGYKSIKYIVIQAWPLLAWC